MAFVHPLQTACGAHKTKQRGRPTPCLQTENGRDQVVVVDQTVDPRDKNLPVRRRWVVDC